MGQSHSCPTSFGLLLGLILLMAPASGGAEEPPPSIAAPDTTALHPDNWFIRYAFGFESYAVHYGLEGGTGDGNIGYRALSVEGGWTPKLKSWGDPALVVSLVLPIAYLYRYEVAGDDFTFTPEPSEPPHEVEFDFRMHAVQFTPAVRVLFPREHGSLAVLLGVGPGQVYHGSSSAGSFTLRIGGEMRTRSRFGVGLYWERTSIRYASKDSTLSEPPGARFVLTGVTIGLLLAL